MSARMLNGAVDDD